MKENKTSSKGLIILIVLLSICVLGLCGYIVYDKVLNKEKNNNNDTLKSELSIQQMKK